MRIRQIDALRAVAVLLVLGCHMTWSPFLVRFGWTGVDMFFVLSGFLISGLLLREYKHTGVIQVKRFMIRRALKIYPTYYVLLALTVGWYAFAGTPIPWSRTWPDLIFVQNYAQGTWGHLWSLGVEEHFYIFLPICLYVLMSRNAVQKLPWIAGTVLIGCFILRAAAWSNRTELVPLRFLMPSQFRFDSLFFGVLLSYFREFHADALERFVTGNRHILIVGGFVGLLPAAIFPQISAVVCVPGLSMLYLGYGSILLLCLYSKGEGPTHNTWIQPDRDLLIFDLPVSFSLHVHLCGSVVREMALEQNGGIHDLHGDIYHRGFRFIAGG
jgi:peptidoglycan/LPS O-acetylase OafA/YrhL